MARSKSPEIKYIFHNPNTEEETEIIARNFFATIAARKLHKYITEMQAKENEVKENEVKEND
ncbi:MAG: hypothetical protein BWY15_01604 [Firmicutes bacterium ADurb.Bin193]|nr:MAG: hypothetical protein BWY15_01604 [Firmicutes bacterium ADurb.Bin193]